MRRNLFDDPVMISGMTSNAALDDTGATITDDCIDDNYGDGTGGYGGTAFLSDGGAINDDTIDGS